MVPMVHPVNGEIDNTEFVAVSIVEIRPLKTLGTYSLDPSVICPLLSGPISILGMATKEEWNGKEAQAGRHHRQAA